MIYSKGTPGNGVWHCPFPPEWVEKMKRAVKHCEHLTAEQIENVYQRDADSYQLPPGDFLSYPQDSRGIPLGYNDNDRTFITCDIYDYNSVPDLVVTDGYKDWPYNNHSKVLTA